MGLYSFLHGKYSRLKAWHRRHTATRMTRTRRIDRVFPPPSMRVVAMTFDDGPTAAPARPFSERGITESILEIMAFFGAHGTFDVIGSTAENYPDTCGKVGSSRWSGTRFDHYPEFGKDVLAGAANQKDLLRKVVNAGHEVANHGFRHLAFGPERFVYRGRAHFSCIDEVVSDQKRLHDLVVSETGYRMVLGRPPHYIDKIPDGMDAYAVYETMGYQYLAASFDGGGWKPSSGNPRKDVEDMIAPLREALEKDPDSLNGQIIFEKDGYNMSLQAPVVAALPEKLKILKKYGYRVVTVRELLRYSAFRDLSPRHPAYEAAVALLQRDVPVAYRDNTVRPDEPCRVSEMLVWLSQSQSTSSGVLREGVLAQGKSAGTYSPPKGLEKIIPPEEGILTYRKLNRIVSELGLPHNSLSQDVRDEPVARWKAILAAVEILELIPLTETRYAESTQDPARTRISC